MRKLSKRSLAIIVGVVVLLAGSGVAYAFFTAGGSGTGTATVGTSTPVTVRQTSTIAGLTPGGPPVALSGNFDNANTAVIHVQTLTAVVTDTSAGAACLPANFAIVYATGTSMLVNQNVPVGTAVGSWPSAAPGSGATIQLTETGVNQDGCKNATVNITYTAAGV